LGAFKFTDSRRCSSIIQSINQSKRIYIAPYVAGESEARKYGKFVTKDNFYGNGKVF